MHASCMSRSSGWDFRFPGLVSAQSSMSGLSRTRRGPCCRCPVEAASDVLSRSSHRRDDDSGLYRIVDLRPALIR